jgi:hypothetical protein
VDGKDGFTEETAVVIGGTAAEGSNLNGRDCGDVICDFAFSLAMGAVAWSSGFDNENLNGVVEDEGIELIVSSVVVLVLEVESGVSLGLRSENKGCAPAGRDHCWCERPFCGVSPWDGKLNIGGACCWIAGPADGFSGPFPGFVVPGLVKLEVDEDWNAEGAGGLNDVRDGGGGGGLGSLEVELLSGECTKENGLLSMAAVFEADSKRDLGATPNTDACVLLSDCAAVSGTLDVSVGGVANPDEGGLVFAEDSDTCVLNANGLVETGNGDLFSNCIVAGPVPLDVTGQFHDPVGGATDGVPKTDAEGLTGGAADGVPKTDVGALVGGAADGVPKTEVGVSVGGAVDGLPKSNIEGFSTWLGPGGTTAGNTCQLKGPGPEEGLLKADVGGAEITDDGALFSGAEVDGSVPNGTLGRTPFADAAGWTNGGAGDWAGTNVDGFPNVDVEVWLPTKVFGLAKGFITGLPVWTPEGFAASIPPRILSFSPFFVSSFSSLDDSLTNNASSWVFSARWSAPDSSIPSAIARR